MARSDEDERRKRAAGAMWLRREMDSRGLLQVELSAKSGLAASTIGNILKCRKGVGPDAARALAEGLGVEQDVVFLAFGIKTEAAAAGGKKLDPLTMTGLRELQAMSAEMREHAVEYLMMLNKRFSDVPPDTPRNGRKTAGTAPLVK